VQRNGFTLLEVLIALAILAIALAAIVRASGSAVGTAITLKERTLAMWVAQNRLEEEMALRAFPGTGVKEGEASQAGEPFKWRETVSETPEPRFRRIEIEVFPSGDESRAAARLIGYLAKQ
jgi:general secretion pathway protein I